MKLVPKFQRKGKLPTMSKEQLDRMMEQKLKISSDNTRVAPKTNIEADREAKVVNKRTADNKAHKAVQERERQRRNKINQVQETPSTAQGRGELKEVNLVDKAKEHFGLANGLGQTTPISDKYRATTSFGDFMGKSVPASMSAVGTGTGLITGAVAAPFATAGAVGLGYVGDKLANKATSIVSGGEYPTWAEFVQDRTGLPRAAAEMTNPLMWTFGARGYKYGDFFNAGTFVGSKRAGNTWKQSLLDGVADSQTGKRIAEIAMRSRYDSHPTANPVPDLIQGWLTSPWNRRRAVLDYIFTGGDFSRVANKPFGYRESLAPFKQNAHDTGGAEISESLIKEFKTAPLKEKIRKLAKVHELPNDALPIYDWGKYKGQPEVAYTGGFWSTHLPRKKGYGDAVDAYLYGTEIDPAYGLRRVGVGDQSEFGVHDKWLKEHRPDDLGKIQIYEALPMKYHIPISDEAGVKIAKNIAYRGNIDTPTASFDADGQRRMLGEILVGKGDERVDVYQDGKTLLTQFPKRLAHLLKGENLQFKDVPSDNKEYKFFFDRQQDLWKYYQKDYSGKWNDHSKRHDIITLDDLGNAATYGIRFIDKAGTPFITRTPWRFDHKDYGTPTPRVLRVARH